MLLLGLSVRRTFQRAPRLLLLVFLSAIARADSADLAGTLPEDYLPGLKTLLHTALQQSPQMIQRQIQIAQNDARVYQADQQRYPNVGGDMRYDSNETGVSGSSGTRTRNSGIFYSLSANQALFYWGEIKHRGDIARIDVAIAQKDYAEAYRMLAVELRRAYLGLIARNADLRQRRYALSLHEADLSNAKVALAHGTKPPGEVAGLQLDFDERQVEFDRYQAEFEGERHRLARLAGVSEIPVEEIPTEIPEPRYDRAVASAMLAAMMRDGAKNAYASIIAQMHVEQAELSYKIAKVRLLPKFNAALSHTRESSTSASANSVTETAITRDTLEVRGAWNIFDGFATKGAKLEALANKRYWDKQREIAADTAMDEAQRLDRIAAIDARAMNLAEQRRAGAAGFLGRTEAEHKVGTASEGNVNDATSNLRAAETNAALTRATFLSDWSAFVSLVADDPVLNNLPARYAHVRP
jgi:outer membrane protein TolC